MSDCGFGVDCVWMNMVLFCPPAHDTIFILHNKEHKAHDQLPAGTIYTEANVSCLHHKNKITDKSELIRAQL